MMKTLFMASAILGMTALLAAQPANAQQRAAPKLYLVSQSQVAQAVVTSLAERGIQVSVDQVKLSADVHAIEEDPALEAGAVEKLGHLSTSKLGELSASVKLKCKVAGACRPFFAVATWQESEQAQQTPKTPVKAATSAQIALKPQALQPAAQAEQTPTAIRAGRPLTLIMTADHMRIQLAVVSLSSASLGQQIRVSTPDHKHTYVAEVLDGSTVKGTL